ncbi:hypothetical protein Vadar_032219 [Vaccinium darrowii]|uniref:Uncharacterized protein n=1 Tax=Vaccinium darrowii TaxID=229202 RepID=A0ACB7XLU9_9ERIC|nr:hypothetical protein Vadar_032219 [Vaccinium darrowii]
MDDTAFDSFLMALKQLISSSKYDLVRERKHELQSLEKKMKRLREFLKLAEKKYDKHSEVTKLVTEIRRVAAMTEKTVDSLILLAFKDDASDSLPEHQTRLSHNLQRVDAEFETLSAEVHQIFYEIEYYSTVGEASKKLKQSSTRRGGSSEGNTSKEVEEQVVVGFKEEMEKLFVLLLYSDSSSLQIISILGRSGAGKTTLARELYNHPFILHTFEVRAWVLVSPYYDKTMKRDLLIHILESISPEYHEDYEKSELDELEKKVLKCLEGRRYLIVMDNIWSIEAWNDIQKSFPREDKGCKVLFTSQVPVQPDGILCIFHRIRDEMLPVRVGTHRVLSFIPIACRGKIGIGHLVHLKYLALKLQSEDWYCELPFSCLLNLQTLNLQAPWHNARIQLPRDIFKMVNLRHLYTKDGVFHYDVSYLSSEEAASIGFDRSSRLYSLRTLQRICSCENCRSFLERTPNLRKLGVYGGLMSQDGVLMLPDLEFLKFLEALRITNERGNREPVLSTFPKRLKFPPHLTRLTLRRTCLKWEELSILKNLPSLEVLKLLSYACRGPVWNTFELGFPQLKYLRFQRLDIEEWNTSEDQFPRLEILVLEECKKLEQIPIDFACLNELREIKIERCRRSVEESARVIQEEQRNKKGDDDCLNLITKENW